MAEQEEKGRDVTRRELADALAEATRLNKALAERVDALEAKQTPPINKALAERVDALEAKQTPPINVATLQRELAEAHALLAARSVQPLAKVPDVKLVPYSGMVKATADCCIEHRYETGAVFHIDVPALWTDDPYVAVIVTGYADDGTPKTEPNHDAPTPIDFRFRKVVSIAEDPTPRRAAEF